MPFSSEKRLSVPAGKEEEEEEGSETNDQYKLFLIGKKTL